MTQPGAPCRLLSGNPGARGRFPWTLLGKHLVLLALTCAHLTRGRKDRQKGLVSTIMITELKIHVTLSEQITREAAFMKTKQNKNKNKTGMPGTDLSTAGPTQVFTEPPADLEGGPRAGVPGSQGPTGPAWPCSSAI